MSVENALAKPELLQVTCPWCLQSQRKFFQDVGDLHECPAFRELAAIDHTPNGVKVRRTLKKQSVELLLQSVVFETRRGNRRLNYWYRFHICFAISLAIVGVLGSQAWDSRFAVAHLIIVLMVSYLIATVAAFAVNAGAFDKK